MFILFQQCSSIRCSACGLSLIHIYGDDANNNNDSNKVVRQKYNKNNYKGNNSVLKMFSDFIKINWVNFWDIFLFKFFLSAAVSIFYIIYPLMIEEEFKIPLKFIGYASSFQGLVSSTCGLFVNQMWPSHLLNRSYYCKLMYRDVYKRQVGKISFGGQGPDWAVAPRMYVCMYVWHDFVKCIVRLHSFYFDCTIFYSKVFGLSNFRSKLSNVALRLLFCCLVS